MKRFFVVAGVIVAVVAAVLFVVRPHGYQKLPIKTDDPWILQTNDPKKLVGANEVYGTYLGNGYIGARIGPEGVGSSDGKPLPCLMAGLYEGESLKALPNWSDFPLFDADGKRFVLDTARPYRQTLNMREGYVETELTLKSGRQRLVGKVTFFIARNSLPYTHSAFCRYDLTPSRDANIGVRSSTDRALFLVPTDGHRLVKVWYEIVDRNSRPVRNGLSVKGGSAFTLIKCTRIWPDVPAQTSDAIADYNLVFRTHKQAWRDTWKSDIVIDGDPAAQQAVHAMMFYLLCSANPRTSIPPNGVSGAAFSGHVFWDADTWMFPALLVQHPSEAAGIVNYRLQTRRQAAENARKRGLQGIEFAWESAHTGRETSPDASTPQERHVTADAAIAASLAAKSPDVDEMIRETAAYWASRVTYNTSKKRYEILKVVPPDEDAGVIDNSVYTNAAAKRNIELGIELARNNHQSYPPKWDDIVAKMYIPFDTTKNRFLAYDGYKGGKTKQADTELLIYPLAYPMADDVKKSTFDFYKTKTDLKRGPAMTSSIHAIIAAELGRPKEAYEHFIASYQPFMRGPMMMFNEKRSLTYDNTCFLTGCGGSLQSVIYGFGGLRVGRAPSGFKEALPGLHIKPCLPPKWKKLQITGIKWGGKSYDLTVTQGNNWKLAASAK